MFNTSNDLYLHFFPFDFMCNVRRLKRTTATRDEISGKRISFQYELSIPANFLNSQSVSTSNDTYQTMFFCKCYVSDNIMRYSCLFLCINSKAKEYIESFEIIFYAH